MDQSCQEITLAVRKKNSPTNLLQFVILYDIVSVVKLTYKYKYQVWKCGENNWQEPM